MDLNNKNMKDFFKKLIQSCRSGDITYIKEIVNSDMVKRINDPMPGKMLIEASGRGNMEIIQTLYSSPILNKHVHQHDTVRISFIKAFEYGHIEASEFLLKKLDTLNSHHDGVILTGMINAIEKGKLNIVKHYYEVDALRVDKEKLTKKILDQSCIYNQLDIAKYIIEQAKMQENKDFSNIMDSMFFTCLKNESFEVLRYFIFDLNIPKTPFIDSALFMMKDIEAANVGNWFNIRELGQSLEKELNNQDKSLINKKMKV